MLRGKVCWFAAVAGLLYPVAASAYVDLVPTLARIVKESHTITVAEVVRFSPEKGAIILKKIRDFKGESSADPLKHELLRGGETAVDLPLLEWAEPGRRCMLFVTGKAAVICVGEAWYQASAGEDGWWRIGAPRPDLPLAYYGTVSRLTDAVPFLIEGKRAVITTVPHGAERKGASFDLALNRASLPGLVKVQRLRADKGMPQMAMGVGSNPAFVLGMGRVGPDELPALRAKLKSASASVRAESAGDLGFLGPPAGDAAGDLTKLLDDSTAFVRLTAASALLRITKEPDSRAQKLLADGLASADAATRRHAARAVGLAGPRAAPLVSKLAVLLKDTDTLVRRTALQAIATLGPSAASVVEPVTALLDRPETARDAADALGRIGPAARPAMKKIGRLLASQATADRWAAVRAMAQIGGDDAGPVVQFISRELPKAPEADGYNMLIYLSLLGPVAKDAIPAIRACRVRNPILRQAAMWAIEPTADLPGSGFLSGAEFAQYILEAYVSELGDHLKPAAQALAKKILAGKAGNVPAWGYKLLARFPNESLAILTPSLSEKDLVMRERATVALGYMGRDAAAAKPHVAQALKNSSDEREQRLLKWCLRELEKEPRKP